MEQINKLKQELEAYNELFEITKQKRKNLAEMYKHVNTTYFQLDKKIEEIKEKIKKKPLFNIEEFEKKEDMRVLLIQLSELDEGIVEELQDFTAAYTPNFAIYDFKEIEEWLKEGRK